jgi:hypothetical protein
MSEVDEGPPKYDVAISFLARDELVARELHDLLVGLNVFFFPRKQEELAGTDGLESMRAPFVGARLVVVLFRAPWGETNWTRVEQTAITDRCLKQGWKGLLFVQLDGTSALPAWLPETHVRFAIEQYGIEQLAGAVKMRVQELGGHISKATALDKARQVRRDADLIADQRSLFRDTGWINSSLHRHIEDVMRTVVALVDDINRELGSGHVAIAEGRRCIIRDGRVSLNVGWRQSIANSVEDEAELIAADFNGPLYMPSERMMTVFPPREIKRLTFTPSLSLAREICWRQRGGKPSLLSGDDLAQQIVTLFLELVARADRGQVEFAYT